jgi:hypothetical protein
MPFDPKRRTFLASVTGLASVGGVALGARSREAHHAALQAASPRAAAPQKWDTAWIDQFKGKHKQLYDLMWHTLRPNTLNPPTFYLDTHRDISGLEFPDVNVVVGVNTSFALNASDALWAKFKLGERFEIKDPATGQPAVRNVYLGTGRDDRRSSVRALQARGAVFMQCNVALSGAISSLAADFGTPLAETDAEVRAGLNPGVKIVPALTWAVGMLQERGFTYEKL